MTENQPNIINFAETPASVIYLDGKNQSFEEQSESDPGIITAERNTLELLEQLASQHVGLVRSATSFKEGGTIAPEDLTNGQLLMLIRAGVGTDNLDAKALAAQGVLVTNTPKATTEAVGEFAVAHALNLLGRIVVSDQEVSRKGFTKHGREQIRGKKVLIIGSGNIGVDAGSKFRALGAEPMLYDLKPKNNYFAPRGVLGAWGDYRKDKGPDGIEIHTGESLTQLMTEADIISFHTPSLEEPILGTEMLAFLKENGKNPYIINTGRHTAIDTEAVLRALQKGDLRGVGLDVFPEEKAKFPDSPVGKLSDEMRGKFNLITTAHMGGNTKEGQSMIGEEAYGYVKRLREGRTFGFGVNVDSHIPKGQVRLTMINRNEPLAHNRVSGVLGKAGFNIENVDTAKDEGSQQIFGESEPTDFNVMDIRNGGMPSKELAAFVQKTIAEMPDSPIVRAWISAGK